MNFRTFLVTLLLILGLVSAMIMDFILFETIKKMIILKTHGQNIIAEVLDNNTDTWDLKYQVEGRSYTLKLNSSEIADQINENSREVELIYAPSRPESAITFRKYNFMNSFFILFLLGFLFLTFAIFVFIKKIFNRSYASA